MEQNKDTITVYWSTPNYLPENESWSMLYEEPVSLLSELRKERSDAANGANTIYGCPASNDTFTNLFLVKQAVDNVIMFDKNVLLDAEKEVSKNPNSQGVYIPSNSGVNLWAARPSSYKNSVNLLCNQGWLFFAEEPLLAEFTAPYYPPISPGVNVRLSPGRFDIGQWFRPFHLDYHIPIDAKELNFRRGDPLFYIKLHTNKKVVFKRFVMNKELDNLHSEYVKSPSRYGSFIPLVKKYEMAQKAKMTEQVLHQIKKNCVE